MHTPEIQMPHSGRRRGRYSDEFKLRVIASCLKPGVSTAAIALANGLNANLVRRWIVESSHGGGSGRAKAATTGALGHCNPAFVPVRLERLAPDPNVSQADIRIELQQGATTVHVRWPISASSQCAQWLREVLA